MLVREMVLILVELELGGIHPLKQMACHMPKGTQPPKQVAYPMRHRLQCGLAELQCGLASLRLPRSRPAIFIRLLMVSEKMKWLPLVR